MSSEWSNDFTRFTGARHPILKRSHNHVAPRAERRMMITAAGFSFEKYPAMLNKVICNGFVFKLAAKIGNFFMGLSKAAFKVFVFFFEVAHFIAKQREVVSKD